MNRNVSIMLIAAVAGIMIASALVVSLTTTSQVFAFNNQQFESNLNGINSHAHNPCVHSGAAEHNPNCQV